MICPNCGTQVQSGLTKCHFCGHILPSERSSDLDKKILYLNKFVALFTILAFAITAAAIFHSILGASIESKWPNGSIGLAGDWTFSILFGFIIAGVYTVTAPHFIKKIIDNSLLKEKER